MPADLANVVPKISLSDASELGRMMSASSEELPALESKGNI